MSLGVEAERGDIILMVGTRKGVFLLTSGRARKRQRPRGPSTPAANVVSAPVGG